MTTAGFIGLGSQGAGMAQRIIEKGVPTTLWARRSKSLDPFRGRAAFAVDPAELGRASEVVGICVTDGAAVREVTLGATGVLAGMTEGSVLAVHSTIGTDECAEIAEAAARRGVDVIDAPVSGGGAAAAAGALTVYVGGTAASVERARPVLETYGDPVLHMGALGSGLRTKLINNVLNAAHFALAHDAMAIGVEFGLDAQQLGVALTSGSGRSFSLEVLVGLGSLDAISAHAGPLLAKDVGLFSREPAPSTGSARDVLLAPADRFLALVGRPRPPDNRDNQEASR
jgi:3-hydroxyisobutyrate dehydrogenase